MAKGTHSSRQIRIRPCPARGDLAWPTDVRDHSRRADRHRWLLCTHGVRGAAASSRTLTAGVAAVLICPLVSLGTTRSLVAPAVAQPQFTAKATRRTVIDRATRIHPEAEWTVVGTAPTISGAPGLPADVFEAEWEDRRWAVVGCGAAERRCWHAYCAGRARLVDGEGQPLVLPG